VFKVIYEYKTHMCLFVHASGGCRCAERAHLLFCVCAAFSSSLTSGSDPQDVTAAQNRVSERVFPMSVGLGRHLQPLQRLPGSSSSSSGSIAVQSSRLLCGAYSSGLNTLK
jgi:hypothetical protein